MLISGTYTALITPFTKSSELDIDAYKNLLQMQVEAGIDGIVILGTTGEAPTLSDEERTDLITVAVKEIQGKVPLFVGCGTNSTKKTIHYAQEAEKLGADGVLLITPYYNRPTQEGLYQHCKMVAESITVPCCVYNAPKRTGQNVEPATVARLAAIPNICFKECNESLPQISEILEKTKMYPHFAFMSGTDYITLPLMALGGHGVISVLSNLMPQVIKQLVTHMQQGDLAHAQALHYKLNSLMQISFIETNPAPIKRMMELAGLCGSTVRLPLVPLTPQNDCLLQETFKTHYRKIYGTESSLCSSENVLSFSGN